MVKNNTEEVFIIRKGERLGRIEGYTGSEYSFNVNTADINKKFLYELNSSRLPEEFA